LLIILYACFPYPRNYLCFALWPDWLPTFYPKDYLADEAPGTWQPVLSSWNDIPLADESYAYLCQLKKQTDLALLLESEEERNLGFFENIVKSNTPTAASIEDFTEYWNQHSLYLDYIDNSERYELICDKTEPRVDSILLSFKAVRSLNWAVQTHLAILAHEDSSTFTTEWIKYTNFILKFRLGSRGLVHEMVWTVVLKELTDNTSIWIKCSNLSQIQLIKLFNSLSELSIQDLGIERSIKAEFLSTEHILDNTLNEAIQNLQITWGHKKICHSTYFILFRRNETLNELRTFYENNIHAAYQADFETVAKNSPSVSRFQDDDNYLFYPIKNLYGHLFIVAAQPAVGKLWKVCWETNIRYQLLRKELADRAGIEVDIRDPLTEKPFLRDDQGFPYSVGIDHIPDSDDDISLH